MSERVAKRARAERRDSIESIMADGTSRKEAERIYDTLTRNPPPRAGHPRGLCGAGFHDFGKIGKRSAGWETVKAPDGTKRDVYKKGLRARGCRNCSKGEQVQTREGYWINSRGLKL